MRCSGGSFRHRLAVELLHQSVWGPAHTAHRAVAGANTVVLAAGGPWCTGWAVRVVGGSEEVVEVGGGAVRLHDGLAEVTAGEATCRKATEPSQGRGLGSPHHCKSVGRLPRAAAGTPAWFCPPQTVLNLTSNSLPLQQLSGRNSTLSACAGKRNTMSRAPKQHMNDRTCESDERKDESLMFSSLCDHQCADAQCQQERRLHGHG